jgi:heat shock protein HslJ
MGLVLAGLLLAAGCGVAGSPGSPSAEGLTGRTFLSTEVKGHTLVEGTRLSIGFPKDGEFTVNAGCNHLFGNLTSTANGKLSIENVGGTDMGCDKARMDQDTWISTFLSSGPAWKLDGDKLVLTSGSEELVFMDREVAEPDQALTSVKWTVDTLVTGEVASSVPQGGEAHLTFSGDGKVTGNTGCNQLNGEAKQDGDKIVFGAIGTTKMLCQGDAGELEKQVLAVLQGPVTMKIDAKRLILTHPSGKGLQLTATA